MSYTVLTGGIKYTDGEGVTHVYDALSGPQGVQGPTGATPQISVGTVTTLAAGENATVSISGTAEAPVMSFGIPRGETGCVYSATEPQNPTTGMIWLVPAS